MRSSTPWPGATRGRDLLLFNLTALDDGLRQEKCQPHLFHVAPNHAMLTDGLVQFLAARKWRNALVLKGPRPEDAALLAAFERSAKRFGVRIVETRPFVLGRDPRERSQNNVALLTAGPDYDVVAVIDTDGEFARDVPYQVQRPRPVVGAAGLVADWWHWAWERHGAPQLNNRFTKVAKRPMTGYDWSAWAAVKAIAESVVRTKATDPKPLAAYLTGRSGGARRVQGQPRCLPRLGPPAPAAASPHHRQLGGGAGAPRRVPPRQEQHGHARLRREGEPLQALIGPA